MGRAYVEADEEKREDVAGATRVAKKRKKFRIWLRQEFFHCFKH
jgi:hypothetical protein